MGAEHSGPFVFWGGGRLGTFLLALSSPCLEADGTGVVVGQQRKVVTYSPAQGDELILEGLPSREFDPARRIFANRSLNLGRIEAVGFELEHSLVCYNTPAYSLFLFKHLLVRLVQDAGYPQIALQATIDPLFLARGLVIDRLHGIVIKLDAHRHVARGYLGHRRLTDDERQSLYGARPVRLEDARFFSADSLDDLVALAALVGLLEIPELMVSRTVESVFADIQRALVGLRDAPPVVAELIERLDELIDLDPELPEVLGALRRAGKRLFVLSDRPLKLVLLLLERALGEDGRSLFDAVIVDAEPTAFFLNERPLLRIAEDGERFDEATELGPGLLLSGGCLRALEYLLGLSGNRILFVSHRMVESLMRSKKTGVWRTLLVVREMEEAIRLARENERSLARIADLEEAALRLDDDIQKQSGLLKSLGRAQRQVGVLTGIEAKSVGGARTRLRDELDRNQRLVGQAIGELASLEATMDARFNPYWGRVFREGNERSHFGAEVEAYADVYTSRVSNLLFYPSEQLFRAQPERMPHERD